MFTKVQPSHRSHNNIHIERATYIGLQEFDDTLYTRLRNATNAISTRFTHHRLLAQKLQQLCRLQHKHDVYSLYV